MSSNTRETYRGHGHDVGEVLEQPDAGLLLLPGGGLGPRTCETSPFDLHEHRDFGPGLNNDGSACKAQRKLTSRKGRKARSALEMFHWHVTYENGTKICETCFGDSVKELCKLLDVEIDYLRFDSCAEEADAAGVERLVADWEHYFAALLKDAGVDVSNLNLRRPGTHVLGRHGKR